MLKIVLWSEGLDIDLCDMDFPNDMGHIIYSISVVARAAAILVVVVVVVVVCYSLFQPTPSLGVELYQMYDFIVAFVVLFV